MMVTVTLGHDEIKNIILSYLHYKEYDLNMVNDISFYEVSTDIELKIDNIIANIEFADDYKKE